MTQESVWHSTVHRGEEWVSVEESSRIEINIHDEMRGVEVSARADTDTVYAAHYTHLMNGSSQI